jgi:hypothetical protein
LSPPSNSNDAFWRSLRSVVIRLVGRGVILIILSIIFIAALYWLTPLFSGSEIEKIPSVNKAMYETAYEGRLPSGVQRFLTAVPLTPFVTVDLIAKGNGDGMESPPPSIVAQKRLRYDNIILYTGIAAVVLLVTWTFTRPRAFAPALTASGVSVSLAIPEPDSKTRVDRQKPTVTAEEFLSEQVRTAAAIANALYDRSTLLISGGIIMAFVGVGVFYVTVPDTGGVSSLTEYLPRVVRPTGILIFVEAIAWFLLRQYRVQIEDYKGFYRIYLRRANLLIALKTVSSAPKDRAQMALAAAFLQDDQSGRLRKHETTETLAALSASDPNPVFDLFRDLVAQVRPSKRLNAKQDSRSE